MAKEKDICPVCKKEVDQSDTIWLCRQTKAVMHFTCSNAWGFALKLEAAISQYREENNVIQS
jgi:predicted amidophosphoribosyltransferase